MGGGVDGVDDAGVDGVVLSVLVLVFACFFRHLFSGVGWEWGLSVFYFVPGLVFGFGLNYKCTLFVLIADW